MTDVHCDRCGVTVAVDKIAEPNRCPDPACPTMPIRGTFTQVDMTNPVPVAVHPIAKAQSAMIGELARLAAPKLSANPEPEDFEDVADYLLRAARIIDGFIHEVGLEVRSSATNHVDMTVFTDVLKDGLEGNATHEIDAAAEAVRDEREEIESAIRNRRYAGAMIEDIYRSFGMPRR